MKQIKKIINRMLPITGEKIVLSNIKISDLVKVKKLAAAEGFEKFTCRPVHKISEEERCERLKKKLASDTCCILGVYDKLSGEIAGYVSIFDYNPRNRAVEIGYHLIEEFRNKGYMKEAINMFNRILFQEAQLNKVMAQTGSFNKESNALLNSCGFSLDGSLRKHHEFGGKLYDDNLYSILKEEYGK